MSKTLGLALGSGGARGVAHIGLALALEEAGIKPDYIAGCSMGAVVGACLAMGMPAAKMRDLAFGLKKRDLVDISPAFISRMAIMRTKKLRDLLMNTIGDVNIEDMKLPFACVATDLYSGKVHVFSSGKAELAVRASCTIPCVFRPVEFEDKLLVDGGVLCRVPVGTVRAMGADVVVAVDALANTFEPVTEVDNIISLILRVFDIMDASQTALRREREEDRADLEIIPKMEGLSQYRLSDIEKAFNEGYSRGKECVPQIQKLLDN